MKIGISGYGFVGRAVAETFKEPYFKTSIYDLNIEKHNNFNVLIDCDFIFVCVPTPTTIDGHQDIRAVDDNLCTLFHSPFKGIVILKSTTHPKVVDRFYNSYSGLRIVGNPEFLNQATAEWDFKNPRVTVIGGKPDDCEAVKQLHIRTGIKSNYIIKESAAAAMFVKYLVNNFFAVKNAYFNEMRALAGRLSIDWDTAVAAALADGRIHPEHTRVPGPDGKCGFGGKCLPKDAQAMAAMSDIRMLKAALMVNNFFRKENEHES